MRTPRLFLEITALALILPLLLAASSGWGGPVDIVASTSTQAAGATERTSFTPAGLDPTTKAAVAGPSAIPQFSAAANFFSPASQPLAGHVAVSSVDPLVARYDTNGNGAIDKSEVIKAINDYLDGRAGAPTKAELIQLINLYLFGPTPSPTPTNTPTPPTPKPAPDLGPPPPPVVRVEKVTGSEVTVGWDYVGASRRYNVRHREQGTAPWTTFRDVVVPRYLVRGLDLNRTHELQVQTYGDGHSHSAVWGRWSASLLVTTGPPPAPTGLTVQGATLSWNPVSGAKSYKVEYRRSGASAWTSGGEPTGTTYTVSGHQSGASYLFRVRAKGNGTRYAAEYGDWTSPPGRVPTPTVISGIGKLGVTWTAPAEEGSSQITGYRVQHKPANQSAWPTTASTVTGTFTLITGLNNGTSYDVRVRACNLVGCSDDWSISESGTPAANPSLLPARPTGLRANGDLDNNGNVAVRWDAADRATGYNLRYAEEECEKHGNSAECGPDPDLPWPWLTANVTVSGTTATVRLPSPPSIITPTYNGVYRTQVQATNTTGASGWSDIAFVYPTNDPTGHRILIGTAPLYGYQSSSAQGSHEFRYVICENTIPSTISASTAVADITAAVETWETAVKWKDANDNNIIKVDKYPLPAGTTCSSPPTVLLSRSQEHNQVMFASNFSMIRAGCLGPPTGCWRSKTWEDSTLAAYWSPLSVIEKGSILLKSSYGTGWDTQNVNGCSYLRQLVVHEAGHSFGIGRPANQHPTYTMHSIMSYEDDTAYCEPQAYDIVAVMANYQSR